MRAIAAAAATLALVACAHTPARPSFRVDVAGKGRPVVLIPDLAASSDVWDTTIAHLGGRYETHALTLPGFAGQPAADGPVLARAERELAGYLRERHPRGAVVVGHMFGAAVAWSLAVHEPDLVAGVVAIDVLPCQSALGEPDEPRAAALEEMRKEHAEMLAGPPPDAAKQERRLRTMMTDPARAPEIARKASLSSQRAVADAFLELMEMDHREAVRALRPPALVVVTDLTYPPDAWEYILASWHRQIDPIPHHELAVIRGAHHYVMFDKPDEWFASLDRFLATL